MSINRRLFVAGGAVAGTALTSSRVVAQGSGTGAGEAAGLLTHHGVLIRVPDFDRAMTIYSERMGLAAAGFWPREGFARLLCNLPVYVQAVSDARTPDPAAAHIAITFMSNNLAASRAYLERAGSAFASDEPNTVAVGTSYRWTDAFGIKHHVLQPSRPTPTFAEPAIYNTGFQLPKSAIPAARRLFTEAMGFKIMTEQYYPPSLPFLEPSGDFGFMAHEHHPWEADYLPREPQVSDIGVSMVFVAKDLAAATTAAVAGDARTIASRPTSNPMATARAFATPGGAPFEIWEWR